VSVSAWQEVGGREVAAWNWKVVRMGGGSGGLGGGGGEGGGGPGGLGGGGEGGRGGGGEGGVQSGMLYTTVPADFVAVSLRVYGWTCMGAKHSQASQELSFSCLTKLVMKLRQ
jgi:hypothetical protein